MLTISHGITPSGGTTALLGDIRESNWSQADYSAGVSCGVDPILLHIDLTAYGRKNGWCKAAEHSTCHTATRIQVSCHRSQSVTSSLGLGGIYVSVASLFCG